MTNGDDAVNGNRNSEGGGDLWCGETAPAHDELRYPLFLHTYSLGTCTFVTCVTDGADAFSGNSNSGTEYGTEIDEMGTRSRWARIPSIFAHSLDGLS